ncbi:MAG: hypothetical protein AAFP04_15745, partial [Myxococcota bacterium]
MLLCHDQGGFHRQDLAVNRDSNALILRMERYLASRGFVELPIELKLTRKQRLHELVSPDRTAVRADVEPQLSCINRRATKVNVMVANEP